MIHRLKCVRGHDVYITMGKFRCVCADEYISDETILALPLFYEGVLRYNPRTKKWYYES